MMHTIAPTNDAATASATSSRAWVLWALMLLAVASRVALPGLSPLNEESLGALLRAEAVLGGAVVFTGAPAPGGDLVQPPNVAYLDALALAVWHDPRFVVIVHGLLAGLAIALVYDLAHRAYGRRAADVAALAYALHPWSVHAARDVAPGALIAPIATLALHGLVLVFHARDPRGWLEAGLAAGLALGTHLAAWPIAVAVFLAVASYPRLARRPENIVGMGAGLLVALPHLAYQIRYGGYDLIGAVGWGTAAPVHGLWSALQALIQSASTWGTPTGLIQPAADALALFTGLLGIGAIVAALVTALRHWARSPMLDRVPLGFLLIDWLILGVIGYALTTRDLGAAGTAMLLPATCVCIGVAAAMPVPPGWRKARGALVAALLVAFGATTLSGYDAIRPNFRHARSLRRHLAQAIPATAPTYVLATPEAAIPYGPRAWRYLLADCHPIIVEPEDGVLALPLPLGRDAYYVLPAPASQLAALEALDAEPLALPNDGRGYTPLLYRLPAAEPAQILALAWQRADVPFAAGIHLLGYTWPTDRSCDAPANLTTIWLITEPTKGRQPRLLIQLLSDSAAVAESLGLGITPNAWQPDTAVIAWHPITPCGLAPGRYRLALGFYDAHTREPYPPAAPTGDAILVTGLAVSQAR